MINTRAPAASYGTIWAEQCHSRRLSRRWPLPWRSTLAKRVDCRAASSCNGRLARRRLCCRKQQGSHEGKRVQQQKEVGHPPDRIEVAVERKEGHCLQPGAKSQGQRK